MKALAGHAGLIDMEGQWSTSDVIYHREINAGGPPWGDNPVWKEQSPSTFAENFSTPIMLTIGEKDFRVPINMYAEAVTELEVYVLLQRKTVFARPTFDPAPAKQQAAFTDLLGRLESQVSDCSE